MRIAIGERLKPFMHQPGTRCLIPGTTQMIEVFPALVRVYDYSGPTPQLLKETARAVTGPVQDFTVQQDLEMGCVRIWGKSQEGFFREEYPGHPVTTSERLSLGNHKSQEWAGVLRRNDFREIFPIWFKLAATLPSLPEKHFQGTLTLLESCQSAIKSGHPETILPTFHRLFSAGFDSLMVPRLEDTQFQGLNVPSCHNPTVTPLWLLLRGADLIRQLFFAYHNQALSILPALPPEFHCGRYLNIRLPIGTLDIEWSKKTIRRAILRSEFEGEIQLKFSKGIKDFRVRKNLQDKGQRTRELCLQPGLTYLLDNFK